MTSKEVVMIVVFTLKCVVIGHLYTYSYKLIVANNKGEISKIKAQLNEEFDMKDLEATKKDTWNRDFEIER